VGDRRAALVPRPARRFVGGLNLVGRHVDRSDRPLEEEITAPELDPDDRSLQIDRDPVFDDDARRRAFI
jgi:hypothetical protein